VASLLLPEQILEHFSAATKLLTGQYISVKQKGSLTMNKQFLASALLIGAVALERASPAGASDTVPEKRSLRARSEVLDYCSPLCVWGGGLRLHFLFP